MDKIFEEMFSKQPDEIIDGDYFYHSPWHESALVQVAVSMGMTREEMRELNKAGWSDVKKSIFWDPVTFQGEYNSFNKPLWIITIHNGNGSHRMNEILSKIAAEGKPFMEIACSEPMGLVPLLLKMNPKLPCIATDISSSTIKCLRSYINRDLTEFNINLAAFDNFNMPIKDNSLDYITSALGISSSSFSNAPNDFTNLTFGKERPLKEVYRILKPGGCFVTIELIQERKFDLAKAHEAYNRYGKLFEKYTYSEIEEMCDKLKVPSWRDKFAETGFQVEIEEKYPQKVSGDEIRTRLYHLANSLKIHEWTDDEKEEYFSTQLVDTKDFEKETENWGIEFSLGVVFYILRKPK